MRVSVMCQLFDWLIPSYCIYSCVVLCYVLLSYECFQESLLDRQDFLQWLLDLLDKSKNADDLLLKYLIPLLLRVCISGRRQKCITAHVCAVQDAMCALIGHYHCHYLPLLTTSVTRYPHLIFVNYQKEKKNSLKTRCLLSHTVPDTHMVLPKSTNLKAPAPELILC